MTAQISPFNGIAINDSLKDYSFVVSGHFHGQSNNGSTFPAATVLSSIDSLNDIQPAFMMSLGDLFMDVDDVYLDHYRTSFFRKLKFPLFNVVGNHDISNGNRYEKEFGKSFSSFIVGSELFILLNTEINDGSIEGEQFNMLNTALSSVKEKNIKNIFVFSHRPVWAERIEKYNKLFLENTRTALGKNNFLEKIVPLLQAHKDINIFWLSGSMGGGPASFFYDQNKELGITFIQTAIRDTPRDAMLRVNVKNGEVNFEGISLTNQKLEKIDYYGVDLWLKEAKPETTFSYRLIPLYLKNMLLHRYFWYGLITCLGMLLGVRFLLKKKK
ncbi:MAG: metallophosphoesterase [Bacteroidia bacterium]|nr:metallophosphoesterase [Bacteroidia bacterium]